MASVVKRAGQLKAVGQIRPPGLILITPDIIDLFESQMANGIRIYFAHAMMPL